MKHIKVLVILAFLSSHLQIHPALAADLVVTLYRVQSDAGHVLLAIYDQESRFLKQPLQVGRVAATSRAQGDSVLIVLHNVPPGRYALSGFHDRNGNGQLDLNLFGIPQEPLGYSNKAKGTMGPPSFADAAIEVGAQDQQLEIQLD